MRCWLGSPQPSAPPWPNPPALPPASYLELADASSAPSFVVAHLDGDMSGPALATWQDVLEGNSWLLATKQKVLLVGGWLLGLIALAGIAVLVGGRMADQL